MKRAQLEHVLRAASQIVDQRDFLVVGSAAILGTYPDEALPLEASRSEEADLAPFDDPTGEKSAAVEGSLGQLSPFHATFGYYADGVDFATATAPDGWEERLVAFEPAGAEPGRGLCLEPHDLAAAKLVAGRIKDFEFVGALLRAGLIERVTWLSASSGSREHGCRRPSSHARGHGCTTGIQFEMRTFDRMDARSAGCRT